ncbi:hypothetical protein AG1IA_07395 [Rhizoctonia solani AG-1 IA]|uniref:Uncharacterized protein n=1 Tax=Thanatephorus cucumeris (strain AG1-IA) TaxID=983506 RepID=L8WK52_THACA|nr:hypothetical protein AG1IA_07395 [Rhizoctonia solani AG-1 IA]
MFGADVRAIFHPGGVYTSCNLEFRAVQRSRARSPAPKSICLVSGAHEARASHNVGVQPSCSRPNFDTIDMLHGNFIAFKQEGRMFCLSQSHRVYSVVSSPIHMDPAVLKRTPTKRWIGSRGELIMAVLNQEFEVR